jgi:hypothetical protein
MFGVIRSLRARLPARAAPRVVPGLSILGLAGLSFMAGTAVMYFQLPPSGFFDLAFAGAKAWYQRGRTQGLLSGSDRAPEGVQRDDPEQTSDGFTLYTTTRGPHARLIDMRGNTVHTWELPFSRAFPRAAHVRAPLPDEQIHWFRAHLYPNGDLLAVYHAEGDTPYGYGLVKLDKDSRLLWAYADNAHHDIDVGEDGAICTLVQKIAREPPPGLDLPGPLIDDFLVVLSPEGRERRRVRLLEAFRDSPYAGLLRAALALPPKGRPLAADAQGDFVHANSVKVLRRSLAPRFPGLLPGQVLVSLRSTHLLAVVDLSSRSVVWAARGVWQSQHSADFLTDGRFLVYDNCGSAHATRLVEYDPRTQAVPWVYATEGANSFRATTRGMQQRLANGNTLLTDPDHWLLLEATRDREIVWKYRAGAVVTGARRYPANELTFLKGRAGARPRDRR